MSDKPKGGEEVRSDHPHWIELDTRLVKLEIQSQNMAGTINSVSEQLKDILKFLNDVGKPQWQNWIAFGGLAVSVLAILGGMMYLPINQKTAANANGVENISTVVKELKTEIQEKDTAQWNRLIESAANTARIETKLEFLLDTEKPKE